MVRIVVSTMLLQNMPVGRREFFNFHLFVYEQPEYAYIVQIDLLPCDYFAVQGHRAWPSTQLIRSGTQQSFSRSPRMFTAPPA